MAGRYDKYLPGNQTYTAPPAVTPVMPAPASPISAPTRSRYDKLVGPAADRPVAIPPGGVNWAGMGKPYGEIKSHDWSPTERMAHDIQDTLMKGGMDAYSARHFGEGLINTGRLNPIVNAVTSGADLSYHLPRGEYVKSAFDALGLTPGLAYGSKFVRGQTQVRNADVPRSVFDKSYLPERNLVGGPDQYGMRPGGGYGPALPSSSVARDELQVAGSQDYNRVAASPVLWHPNALNDNILSTMNELRQYGTHGQPHTPENSPEFYAAMTRWYNNHAGRATPVTALEFDQLRRELRALPPGPSGIAGGKAADRIDDYMHTSPPGMVVSGNQQQLDALRSDLADARGNWRAYKTADTVERDLVDAKSSARVQRKDEGQAVRNVLDEYANSQSGRDAIYGATAGERAVIGQAAQGTGANWFLNKAGDVLSTGKAAGAGALAGGTLGNALGLDYLSSLGLASVGGGIPMAVGGAARWGAQPGMARSAQEALDTIRMNSPLYRQRAAPPPPGPPPPGTVPVGGSVPSLGGAPVDNPNIMARDAIAYALMPQVQREGQDIWAGADAPFEPRVITPQPPAPQRIIVDQPAESWDPLLGEQR